MGMIIIAGHQFPHGEACNVPTTLLKGILTGFDKCLFNDAMGMEGYRSITKSNQEERPNAPELQNMHRGAVQLRCKECQEKGTGLQPVLGFLRTIAIDALLYCICIKSRPVSRTASPLVGRCST